MRFNVSKPTVVFVVMALIIHAVYITILSQASFGLPSTSFLSSTDFMTSPLSRSQSTSPFAPHDTPPLFIYRRTKKTGSSSMLTELLTYLVPLGYVPLYYDLDEMDIAVHNEYVSPHPRHLFVAEHNHVTRSFHPQNQAVIADTVRDGYAQMTSFCRYVLKVRKCSDEVAQCLRSAAALEQINYRWAGRKEEDADTYIDLPLSSAHPALSTTVMRTVYPNISLDISAFNVRHSACPEVPEIRAVYDDLYGALDSQIADLKRRILVVSGYPYALHKKSPTNVTVDEMLNAAESIEKEKYHFSSSSQTPGTKKIGYSDVHFELRASIDAWVRDKSGKMTLRPRRS